MKRKFWILFLCLFFLYPSSGPNFSSHAFDGGGDVAWTNPSNAQVEDGNFATVVDASLSFVLDADTYGFSIAGGSSITGIQIEVKIKTSITNSAGTYSLEALKAGVPTGNSSITSQVTTTLGWRSFGGDGQLWGTTWTPSDINATNFGCDLTIVGDASAGTISVDAFRITVFYTAAATGAKKHVIGYGGGKIEIFGGL